MTTREPVAMVAGGQRGSRAALAGAVFAVLFVAGWILLQQSPPLDAPASELVAYYSDPEQRRASVLAGLYVVPFGGIAFIWFMAALRDRYVRAGGQENVLLSTTQLVSGTLYVSAIFAVAAIELSLVWMADQPPDPNFTVDSARAMVAFGAAMREIVALRAGAVFIAVSSTRAMRSGLFPRWYGALSMLGAIALLFTYSAFPLTSVLMPLWVVGTSVLVMVKRSTLAHPAGN